MAAWGHLPDRALHRLGIEPRPFVLEWPQIPPASSHALVRGALASALTCTNEGNELIQAGPPAPQSHAASKDDTTTADEARGLRAKAEKANQGASANARLAARQSALLWNAVAPESAQVPWAMFPVMGASSEVRVPAEGSAASETSSAAAFGTNFLAWRALPALFPSQRLFRDSDACRTGAQQALAGQQARALPKRSRPSGTDLEEGSRKRRRATVSEQGDDGASMQQDPGLVESSGSMSVEAFTLLHGVEALLIPGDSANLHQRRERDTSAGSADSDSPANENEYGDGGHWCIPPSALHACLTAALSGVLDEHGVTNSVSHPPASGQRQPPQQLPARKALAQALCREFIMHHSSSRPGSEPRRGRLQPPEGISSSTEAGPDHGDSQPRVEPEALHHDRISAAFLDHLEHRRWDSHCPM